MPLFQLTLPDCQDPPAERLQPCFITLVPHPIRIQFLFPEFDITRWHNSKPASGVAMPETPMHKDNSLVHRENQIGFTRQLPGMKPEAQPSAMQIFSDQQFRFCVFSLNTGHHSAACRLVNDVNHQASNRPNAARNTGRPAPYASSPFDSNISAAVERNPAPSASETVPVP